jgi:hypothetical protein
VKVAAAAIGAAVVAAAAGWVAFVWTWCERDRYDRGHLHE